jgi:hypothetical protein
LRGIHWTIHWWCDGKYGGDGFASLACSIAEHGDQPDTGNAGSIDSSGTINEAKGICNAGIDSYGARDAHNHELASGEAVPNDQEADKYPKSFQYMLVGASDLSSFAKLTM